MIENKLFETPGTIYWNSERHRRFRSIYLSSDPWKNYPSASEGIFGFSWIMFSTDAKIRACFTTFLAARAPSRHADFSTLKFQLLIVRLSQDLVSVDIFENEDHLEHRINIFRSLFVPSNASKGVKFTKWSILVVEFQNFGYLSIFKSDYSPIPEDWKEEGCLYPLCTSKPTTKPAYRTHRSRCKYKPK